MGKRINKSKLKLAEEVTGCLKALDREQMITITEMRLYK